MIPKFSLRVHLLNKTEFFRRTPPFHQLPSAPPAAHSLEKKVYKSRSKVPLTPGRQKPCLSTTKQKSWLLTPVPLKSERGVVWVLWVLEEQEKEASKSPSLPMLQTLDPQEAFSLRLLFLGAWFTAGPVADSRPQLLLIRPPPNPRRHHFCGDFAWILDPGGSRLPGSGFHWSFIGIVHRGWIWKAFLFSPMPTSKSGCFSRSFFFKDAIFVYFPDHKSESHSQ